MPNENISTNITSLKSCVDSAQGFSSCTLAGEYLSWLADLLKENQEDPLYRDDYKPIVEASKDKHNSVFGSVIMRTQGRRPEALREALLCLYAQSEQDFEVLLIGHKLTEEGRKLVQQVLTELEPEFRKKIRFLPLDYGTRTTPLNYGFANAYGQYIMIFDDDDLVMEDWMMNFKKAAQERPDTLLHCFVAGQKWDVLDTAEGIAALRATHAPDSKYCVPFDMISELTENVCPPIGLAFPAKAFRSWGLIFDETLNTTEDWDYMMRVAFLTGVTDVPVTGAVYRLWTNAESSATLHDITEWQKNYHIIQDKFKKVPLALSKGQAMTLQKTKIEYVSEPASAPAAVAISPMQQMDAKLYFGMDGHWSEECSMVLDQASTIGKFYMEYTGLSGKHTHHQIRWDPASYSCFIIRGLSALITDEDGKSRRLTAQEIHSNGEIYHDGILFLKEDPQVFFDIPKDFKLATLTVWGTSVMEMPIWENSKSLKLTILLKKILRKLRIRK